MVSGTGFRVASRTRSAHDLVTQGIGQSIMQGRFPIGSILPGDAELMEHFGVSRTALREAMKTLAAKGLIESKTKVGTKVLDRQNWNMFDADILGWHLELGVDAQFLGWLFEIRQTLEPLACAAAALRWKSAQLESMNQALQSMYQCEKNRQGFTKADLAFHQAVLEASGNPFLQSIGSVIGAALATSFTISSPVSSDAQFKRVMRQHQDVFEAIKARDSQGASDAMSMLIVQAAERVQIKLAESTIATIQVHSFSKT